MKSRIEETIKPFNFASIDLNRFTLISSISGTELDYEDVDVIDLYTYNSMAKDNKSQYYIEDGSEKTYYDLCLNLYVDRSTKTVLNINMKMDRIY